MIGLPKTFSSSKLSWLREKVDRWLSDFSGKRISHISLSVSTDGRYEGNWDAYERLLLTVWSVDEPNCPRQHLQFFHSGEKKLDESIKRWLAEENLHATNADSVAFGNTWDIVAVVAE